MKINGKTDIGCNRAENQDTFRSGKIKGACWGVVCDGVGGARHGKLASGVAADTLEKVLHEELQLYPDTPLPLTLNKAIQQANNEVYARSGSGREVMGTTVVCAIVKDGQILFGHVGDSRGYLYEDGVLRQITHDHSMVQELVDMGVISRSEARKHPEKNVITRALGVEDEVEPSFVEEKLEKDVVILLCTDGLTNMVSETEIANIIKTNNFWDVPRELVKAALAAGGDDNITVLLMAPEARDFK